MNGLTFTGSQTRLGAALNGAREELAGLPVSGVVLVSDGADTSDASLGDALLGMKAEKLPVYTVGVGSAQLPRDVEIDRVSTPRTDDTTNTGVFSSSTGLTALNFTLINLGLAEGSASAPSLSPTNFPDTGLYFPSDDIIDFSTDGSVQVRITTTALQILTNAGQLSFGASADLKVFRDAANTLARRDGTANQTDNHYARYVSTTNFNRTATKDISTTL